MNKHAQNLRALPVILPADIDPAILDTLARAADEIDRLQQYAEFPILVEKTFASTRKKELPKGN